MKTNPRLLRPRPRQTRVFTALLVSFMLLVTPVMPLASASAPGARFSAAAGYSPAAALAPSTAVISATKTDSFTDPNADGKAEPGDTITYDVNVSNSGASDATGVNFTDTIDPNTTLVPGSLRVSPLAFPDSYNATKDIAVSIPAPGVLANDTGTPSPAAQPIAGGATSQGGTVTLNADGSFSYTPPAGFQGADTFNYTATNGQTPDDTATVTINVDAGPAVTSTSPANGATSVAHNSDITINFSEPVNATTGSFSVQCPAGTPQAFTLSASPSASFTLNPSADLPPGATCTVTVFANQITDVDSFDPPDQMAADYTFSFGVGPLAVDDMRSATGNVRINTAASGYSVLANDQAPGASITAFDATSAHGGEVTMNTTTGTFTYDPPRGFTGNDSFNYTISNAAGSDTGTVVLTVTHTVWFINNAPGACSSGCDGRLTHPFTSVADFEAVNGNGTVSSGAVVDPEAGDNIFIYTGGSNYSGPLTLENNQVVIGQGATSDLSTLTGIAFAADSDALPSTGGTAPSITSAGNGFNLAANNQLYGLAFSNTVGTAISDGANVGTLVIGDVSVDNTGTAGAGISLTSGGTFTASGVNTLATGTGTALNVTNTDIGAGGITFRSISSNGGGAGTSGIILNNTGALGGLTVTGNGGTCSAAANCTGGAILNKGVAVSLTNTQNVSLTRLFVQNTTGSGVAGTQVTNFTLANSVIDNAGTSLTSDQANSAVFFGKQSAGNEQNLSGVVNITNNTLTNMYWHGISIVNFSGTISGANISNNTLTSPASTATSKGTGIQLIALGQPAVAGAASITAATINQNTVSNFPSSAGLALQCGNTNVGGQTSTCGSGGANLINVTNNIISGQSAANRIGTQGILATYNGLAAGNLNISGNNLSNIAGNVISHSVFGVANVTTTINGNTITANNSVASSGITVGTSLSAGFTSAPVASVKITNNVISRTDGNGILAVARDNATGSLGVTIKGNTVAAPLTGVRQGIRVDAGNATGDNDVCLDIANNTSAGSGGATGIGLRKQGTSTTINAFGIEGMAATATPGVEAFVNAQNPSGGGTQLISATSGFTSCSSAPDVASLGINSQDAAASGTTAAFAQASVTAEASVAATTVAVASGPLTAEPRVWSDMPVGRDAGAADESAASNDGGDASAHFGARIVSASYERPAKARARRNAAPIGDAVVRTADANDNRAAYAARTGAALTAPVSGETVNASIGTLPAGKTVHISFQVTVNNPFGGTNQVSNQGTVSGDNFAPVQTDDPAAGGSADPTVTPILTPPDVAVRDASVAEPATGQSSAAFAVTLSHAYTHAVTVNYATADDSGGANPAAAGSDYTATSGTLTFNPGETVQTISVPVLADADATETNETFLVNISGATGGSAITDAQAVGTITPDSTPGTVVISELRTSGPAGADDDFVELLNNTDADITVQASDSSAGWALVKSGSDCSATPVVVAVIPNGTVIRARGNYLVVGSAYSLGAYAAGDQTLVFGIEDDHNVALFNTAELANISTAARLDAVGFGSNAGGNCDLLREGATLQPASGSTSEYSFVRKVDKGATQDTNENASDFVVVSTTPATPVGSNPSPTLGAPGPENSTGARGPVPCNVPGTAKIERSRLDSTVAVGSAPNTVRDSTSDPGNNSTYGTIDFRRRFTNNTGGQITRLRFRITNTTNPSTPGAADLRARSSSAAVVGGVNDAATCGGSAPCNVTVQGTTLEQPPTQSGGGGVNSTLGVGTISLATPLVSGASVNLHLLFGVQQHGDYHLSIVIEAETGGSIGQDVWELRGNTQNGGDSDGGCNTPPVANAGADQVIECGGGTTSVVLDGSASTDADGDALTYEWREGATVLGTNSTLNTSLSFGPHTITLKVTDPSGDFSEDTVSVNIVDTTDPLITAPPNVSVNTGPGATSCGAFVSDATLGTASASDGCSASVTVTRTGVPAGNVFPVGTTIVTYTADDGHGHTRSAYQSVTVTDNTPPTVSAPPSVNVNAPANSCSVSLNPGQATAGDNCPGVTVAGSRSDAQPLNAPYSVGTTTITWTATDAHGNTASATQTVKVNDVTPPTITLTTGTISLAPPNHAYQTFSIANLVASVSDGCDASVDINDVVISKVTSDEPEDANGNGDGNTLNDIVIAPDCKSLQLRSERSGNGDGRVYTITLQVKDSSGNVATAVRKVFVPNSGQAIDSGTQYTVNGCNP